MGNAARAVEQREAILEVECTERDGTYVRAVRPARLSVEKLRYYYEKLKDFDTIFNDFVANNFQAFISQFVVDGGDGNIAATGLIWEVDDVGIFRVTDIIPMHQAKVHPNFWDGRFRGREDLCREMCKYLFERYKFHRLVAEVPLYSKATALFAKRVGFEGEGRMREATLYKGEWFDMWLFSLLRHEV